MFVQGFAQVVLQMSNLILRLAKRSLRKEKGDVKLDSVGGVGDMGCGMWAVGCGTIPTKGRLSGNEYFGYDSFSSQTLPWALQGFVWLSFYFLQ